MEDARNIKELINRVNNETLSHSLDQIKDGSKAIWNPSRRIIRDYTDHGIEHSDRIAGYIINLIRLYKGDRPLSDQELYVLSAGICLHDIGMQCDVARYSWIRNKAEEFKAKFGLEFKASKSSDYSQKEQDSIRENHHYLTAAWIDFDYNNKDRDKESAISRAIKSIPSNLVEDVRDVCLYHSKMDLAKCDKEFRIEKMNRKQLVAALLRLGDELDIDWNRVSEDAYKAFRIPPSNQMYWYLHDRTTIYFDKDSNSVKIVIALNSNDFKEYSQLISEIYTDHFRIKNEQVREILIKNSIPISIIPEITKYDYVDKLPSEIVHAMIELKAKMDKKKSAPTGISLVDAISLIADIPSMTFRIRYDDYLDDWHQIDPSSLDIPNKESIVLIFSDKLSQIRLDSIELEGIGISKILQDYLNTGDYCNWPAVYSRMPWLVNRAVGYYYSRNILGQDLDTYPNWGTGISIQPAGIKYPFFACKGNEWIIAWTNPRYSDKLFTNPGFGDRMIGIHASFEKDYPAENIYSGGDTDKYPLSMQKPLSNLLESIRIELA